MYEFCLFSLLRVFSSSLFFCESAITARMSHRHCSLLHNARNIFIIEFDRNVAWSAICSLYLIIHFSQTQHRPYSWQIGSMHERRRRGAGSFHTRHGLLQMQMYRTYIL